MSQRFIDNDNLYLPSSR